MQLNGFTSINGDNPGWDGWDGSPGPGCTSGKHDFHGDYRYTSNKFGPLSTVTRTFCQLETILVPTVSLEYKPDTELPEEQQMKTEGSTKYGLEGTTVYLEVDPTSDMPLGRYSETYEVIIDFKSGIADYQGYIVNEIPVIEYQHYYSSGKKGAMDTADVYYTTEDDPWENYTRGRGRSNN